MNRRDHGHPSVMLPFLGLLWLVAASTLSCGNVKIVDGDSPSDAGFGAVDEDEDNGGGATVDAADLASPNNDDANGDAISSVTPDLLDAGADVLPPACSSTQVVEPVSAIGVYEENACLGSPTDTVCTLPGLMPRLLACDAVSFMFSPRYSLAYDIFRVAERRQDTCVIEMWEDYEARERYWRCELPLPLAPWKGLLTPQSGAFTKGDGLLDGIMEHCQVFTCCIFTDFCGTAHCDPGYRSFGC